MKRYVLILHLLCVVFATNAQQTDSLMGTTAPANVSKDYEELTRYLCEGVMDDQLKAKLIFNWVTHNISFDIAANRDPEKQNPSLKEILRTKKTVTNGYIKLYVAMCTTAGLDAVDVVGYGKHWTYDKGDDLYIPRAGWCAVKINEVWEFVDPMSGAGYITHQPKWLREQLNKLTKNDVRYVKRGEFEQEYDSTQFMINPVTMRSQRIAADPIWQLVRNPMPLSIFKQGDSVIVSFLLLNNKRLKNTANLERIAGYNARQRVADRAARTHKYNPHFWLDVAHKEHYEAILLLSRFTDKSAIPINQNSLKALNKARQKTETAKTYIDTQINYIPQHYTTLKKKNSDKNLLAKTRFRDLKTNIKQISSKLKSQNNTFDRKIESLAEQKRKNNRILDTTAESKIDEVETISIPKSIDDPMVKNITDSIDAREGRIDDLEKEEEQILTKMLTLVEEEQKFNKRMAERLPQADSLLRLEAFQRELLSDSYDDEIIKLVNTHDLVWKHSISHTQMAYFDNVVAMIKKFAALKSNYKKQMLLYRGVIKNIEIYKRLSEQTSDVGEIYVETVARYKACVDRFNYYIDQQTAFYGANKGLYKLMEKAYEEDVELIEKMEKVENQRKEIENTILADRKAYDEKELEMIKGKVQEQIDEIDEILSKFE